jgi:hypothetical protein
LDRRPLLTGVEATLLGVVALTLVVAAVIGSGGEEQESRTTSTEERSAVRHTRTIDVNRIKRRVERIRGLRFRRPLKVSFLSPERAQRIFRSRMRSEYSDARRRVDEEVLKLLGLIEPSVDLQGVLAAVADEEVLGFYDDRTKQLVVIRKPTDSEGLLEIVLAHELVHALEDQHFDFRGEAGFTDDESSAASALIEGTATALMTDYATRYLKPADLLGVLESVSGTETKLPKFIERSLLFPYIEGEKFVTTFREGGNWRAIDKVYELRQPSSTEQILHPEKYAIDERPSKVRVDDVSRRLGDGWARLDTTGVGEFDLRLLFRQVGRLKGAASAAGWGGGRLELWRRRTSGAPKCPAPCLKRDVGVMRLAWDSDADRQEGDAALQRVFERGLRGKRLAAKEGVGLWSSRGGAIGMLSNGRTSTVVFAPTVKLAARLLAPQRTLR